MKVNLFTPYPKQREVIDSFATSKHLFGVVVAPRGSGKTLLAINMLLYWLLKEGNSKGGWISPIFSQGKSVFEQIVKSAFSLIKSSNKADLTIEFINGSTIKFLSADRPDSVRGFRFNYLVLDETAFISEKAIEEAILPTLNPGGKKCLLISTPKSKNHFYKWYMRGIEDDKVISFKIPLTECPYVKDELIEEARLSLPPDVFKQEYEAEFTDASNDVFTGVEQVCILDEWTEPQRGKNYYFGVDVALSADYSVLTILDESLRVCKVIRLNQIPYAEIGKIFVNEIKRWPGIQGYVETNGIGRPLFELIRSEHRKTNEFVTTNSSKTEGIRNLIYKIQNQEIELPSDNLFPHLKNELAAYSYKTGANGTMTFNAPNGLHDDCVMSLMMALQAREKLAFKKSKIYVSSIR